VGTNLVFNNKDVIMMEVLMFLFQISFYLGGSVLALIVVAKVLEGGINILSSIVAEVAAVISKIVG